MLLSTIFVALRDNFKWYLHSKDFTDVTQCPHIHGEAEGSNHPKSIDFSLIISIPITRKLQPQLRSSETPEVSSHSSNTSQHFHLVQGNLPSQHSQAFEYTNPSSPFAKSLISLWELQCLHFLDTLESH